jgi:IS5 family transposase
MRGAGEEEATPANVFEGRKLPDVLEKRARRVTADKAYDSNRNHHLLANRNIHSAIILKRNRLGHSLGDKRSDCWIQDDQRKRRRIEPKMAELKHLHDLVRARYWTLPKMKIQLHLAVIAANVKRIVKLLSAGTNPLASALAYA